jgi:hypothetical protein
MNQPFKASTRPSALSDARGAGAYYPAACGRANAVSNAAAGVRGLRRSPELREELS